MPKLVEVQATKEFASTFLADIFFKMAVNRVLDAAPAVEGVTIQKWIPVTERLPEYGVEVLVFTVDKVVTTSSCVALRVDRYQDITHWMPLPEPPEVGA